MHYHEGAHEATGCYYCALVPDKRNDCVLQVAEVFPATAEPVPDVVNGYVTIRISFELALNLEVFVYALQNVVRRDNVVWVVAHCVVV